MQKAIVLDEHNPSIVSKDWHAFPMGSIVDVLPGMDDDGYTELILNREDGTSLVQWLKSHQFEILEGV